MRARGRSRILVRETSNKGFFHQLLITKVSHDFQTITFSSVPHLLFD